MGVAGVGSGPLSVSASKYVSQESGGSKEVARTSAGPTNPKIITTEVGFLMLTCSQLLLVLVYLIMVLLKLDRVMMDFSLKVLITFCHSILTPLVMTGFSLMEMGRQDKDLDHATKRLERRLQRTR